MPSKTTEKPRPHVLKSLPPSRWKVRMGGPKATAKASPPASVLPHKGGGGTWPGPKSTALFEEEQKFIAPGIQSIALLSKLAIDRGQGSWLWDVDGNKYLDFSAGVSV